MDEDRLLNGGGRSEGRPKDTWRRTMERDMRTLKYSENWVID
jgi:hypothetical protein